MSQASDSISSKGGEKWSRPDGRGEVRFGRGCCEHGARNGACESAAVGHFRENPTGRPLRPKAATGPIWRPHWPDCAMEICQDRLGNVLPAYPPLRPTRFWASESVCPSRGGRQNRPRRRRWNSNELQIDALRSRESRWPQRASRISIPIVTPNKSRPATHLGVWEAGPGSGLRQSESRRATQAAGYWKARAGIVGALSPLMSHDVARARA